MKRGREGLVFLEAEQIIRIHDVLLDAYGGDEGGGHGGEHGEGADAAAQAVKNSYYEHPLELAAAYAVYVIQGHIFLDACKRTGSGAMLAFLEGNKIKPFRWMKRPRQENIALMIELQQRAEVGESPQTLIAWLAKLL